MIRFVAYAATCQRDQYDRPTFGMINFCPAYLDANTNNNIFEKQLMTALHEIGHVLGFSSTSFPLMRHADGSPRTPRKSSANVGPTRGMNGTCNNGSTGIHANIPGPDTIISMTRQRQSQVQSNAEMVELNHMTMQGHMSFVTILRTEKVRTFVRAHFQCDAALGAEIENNDPGCVGSHWYLRLYIYI
jgi:leishmanolysin-like peptidase